MKNSPAPFYVRLPQLMLAAIDWCGRQVLRLPAYVFAITMFIVRVLNPKRQGRYRLNKGSLRMLVSQVLFSGIDALPIIALLSLTAGAAITSQAILTLQVIGDSADVAELVVRVAVYELCTLLTAIVLIARSGSAICVDLGNMKLNKEMLGLEMLGINIPHFLLVPRILGTAIAQLILAIFTALFSVVGGVLLLVIFQHDGYFSYLAAITYAIHPFDLLVFMGKNLLFGLLIGAIACYHAMQVQVSRTELPQQTQQALIYSISVVFVLNALFTLLVHQNPW